MKALTITLLVLVSIAAQAQDSSEVRTLFNSRIPSGGYAAISNKFTSVHGGFANMPEIYGGWFIGRRFMIGVGGGATTNYIKVPTAESARPDKRMSYLYGQAGLVTEYVIASNSPIHPVIHMFNGAGYSLQYERPEWDDFDEIDYNDDEDVYGMDWCYVSEIGVQVELNLFKWMRLSPGVSYRFAFDKSKLNKEVSGPSVSVAMKFGKF